MIKLKEPKKYVDLDLDVFVDGWRQKGDGYVWVQRGTDVQRYIPEALK